MTPASLAILLATLALGVILLSLGRRGRRLDRTPVCRTCGVDISATLPQSKTCPECGSGLNRPKAVRLGHRKHIIPLVILGAILTLLPISVLRLSLYATLTGTSFSTYKPVPLLLAQARHGNTDAVAEAGNELLSRLNAGTLDDSQLASLVQAILEQQADPAAPWHESLGDIIETAELMQRIDKATYQQFLNNAMVFGFEPRAIVARTDPVPIHIVKLQDRIGSLSEIRMMLTFQDVKLGGVPLDLAPGYPAGNPPRPVRSGMDSRMITAWGSASRVTSTSGGGQVMSRMAASPLPLGPAELSLSYTVEGQPFIMGRAPAFGANPDKVSPPRDTTVSLRIVPENARDLQAIPASDELHRQIVQSVGASLRVRSQGSQKGIVLVSFDLARLPVPLAHRVFLSSAGGELPLGQLVHVAAPDAYPGDPTITGIQAGVPIPDVKVVTLILRPDPSLAANTVNITRYYNGEIVFQGVQVQRQ